MTVLGHISRTFDDKDESFRNLTSNMSEDACAEVFDKLLEWEEAEVKANIDNVLPILLSALSSDNVALKFQGMQALLTTCLPCMPVLEVEERLLQHAVPVSKQLFYDAIECLHSSLEDGFLTQADGITDKLISFLEVCSTILKCSGAVLEFVASQGTVDLSTFYSVPENIALVLLKTFEHCKESESLYGHMFESVSEVIANMFRESHQVQVMFFNVLAENIQFKSYIEDELQLLIRVLEAISDGGEILFCLDPKSMAEQWKGYSRLTHKYAAFLQSNFNLFKPLSALVSEVERLLGEVIKAPSTDLKLTGKCLKIGGFLLKIIVKLTEQFRNFLEESAPCLFNLVLTLISHSSLYLTNSSIPQSVIEEIQRYLVVAADPLLVTLCRDHTFRQEFLRCCIKMGDSTAGCGESERIPVLLILSTMRLLLQSDPAEKSLWISKDEKANIFSAVFCIVKFGHEDFQISRSTPMVMKKGASPKPIDVYGALVSHCGALILSAQTEDIGIVEGTLLDNILQPNPWPALLASDLLILLARTASSKMCLDQVIFFSEMTTLMLEGKIQCPQRRHLCSLLRRLVPLLSNQDKTSFVERFPPRTHPALWREIGVHSLPENIKTSSVRDLASIVTDAIAKFLGNGQVTLLIKGLEAAVPALKSDPRSISASSLFSVWSEIPANESTLSPWLSKSETRDSVSCWLTDLLCVLCEATSFLVTSMTNQQIALVLQRLRFVSPLTSSVLKLHMLEILRSLALKVLDSNVHQSSACQEIAALFGDLLQDKNPIVCWETLETFSHFTALTKHERICVDTVSGAPKLRQMVENYLKKSVPSSLCSPAEMQIFVHQCVPKEIPNTSSESPPVKKLKFDENDFTLDGCDFLGADFFEGELHSAVEKLTESCADVVNYASANPIPKETVKKLTTIVADLQKVIASKN